MAKKIKEEVVEKKVVTPKNSDSDAVAEMKARLNPKFDPDIPENRQRWYR